MAAFRCGDDPPTFRIPALRNSKLTSGEQTPKNNKTLLSPPRYSKYNDLRQPSKLNKTAFVSKSSGEGRRGSSKGGALALR